MRMGDAASAPAGQFSMTLTDSIRRRIRAVGLQQAVREAFRALPEGNAQRQAVALRDLDAASGLGLGTDPKAWQRWLDERRPGQPAESRTPTSDSAPLPPDAKLLRELIEFGLGRLPTPGTAHSSTKKQVDRDGETDATEDYAK